MAQRSILLERLEDPEASIERVALAIARDEYPTLDEASVLARFDELAAPLAPRLARARTVSAQAGVLGTYVYDELGFRGNEDDYYDPRNSYLNCVVERRLGIPITLATVLMALGRRAGVTIEGVAFPGHFLVRLGGTGGVFIDPFFRARLLSRGALETLAKRSGVPASRVDSQLVPVDTRAMAIRMLSNLKAVHEARRDHARALVVCDRLVDLVGTPELRRDRGLHALSLGAVRAARFDLEYYLGERPEAADAGEMRARLEGVPAPATTTLQ